MRNSAIYGVVSGLLVKSVNLQKEKVPTTTSRISVMFFILRQNIETVSKNVFVKPLYATDLFNILPENHLWFSYVFRGYVQKPAEWNGLLEIKLFSFKR